MMHSAQAQLSAPHPPARAKTGIYVGLGIGALAIGGAIVAIVMLMGGGPRGGAGSREDAVKRTFAALAAGDAEALVKLTGSEDFGQFVTCKKQPPAIKDVGKVIEQMRTMFETATEATKGTKIEIVKIGEDHDPQVEPKGKQFGGAEYGCTTTVEAAKHRFDVAIKITRGDGKPVEQETQVNLIAVDGKWFLESLPRIKLDDHVATGVASKGKLDDKLPTDVPSHGDDNPAKGTPATPGDAPTTPGDAPTTPSAAPKNDWNTAAGDHTAFNAAEWFPETGDIPIQHRPYIHLAKDDRNCTAAEPSLRSMLGADCISIIRSLWTNAAKTHVGSISVVSLTDNATARALQNRLSAGQSNGDYVQFIPPPANSGVRFSERSPTWVGAQVSGHYMVVIEVARTNGKATDQTAKTMFRDLQMVATDHIIAVTSFGD